MIEGDEVAKVTGLSIPHTSHCLGSGDIMISAMGDKDGNAKGWSNSRTIVLIMVNVSCKLCPTLIVLWLGLGYIGI